MSARSSSDDAAGESKVFYRPSLEETHAGFAGNGIIYALSNVHNISITLHNAKLHERPFGMHA